MENAVLRRRLQVDRAELGSCDSKTRSPVSVGLAIATIRVGAVVLYILASAT